MRPRRIGKRITLVDFDLELAAPDQIEHLRGGLFESLAGHEEVLPERPSLAPPKAEPDAEQH